MAVALVKKETLREGFVIVASILIAFGVDAAWSDHQDAVAEERILTELLDEFERSKGRIEGSISELRGVLGVAEEFFDHLGPEAPRLSADSAEALLDGLLSLNTLEVPQSVLNSVISSGQFRLIQDRGIRQRLAEWPALVQDVQENHAWHRVETDERLVPMVAPYVAVRSVVHEGIVANAPDQTLLTIGRSTFALDPVGLQRDPAFEALLASRVTRQTATLVESYVLLQATEEIIRAIQVELGLPESSSSSASQPTDPLRLRGSPGGLGG